MDNNLIINNETIDESPSITSQPSIISENVQNSITDQQGYIPQYSQSSLFLYNSLQKEVVNMPPFKQRELYDRASYKLEDARFQKLRDEAPLLFNDLLKDKDRPLTHEELGSIENPFVRVATGFSESISGKYYQEAKNRLMMKELFNNNSVIQSGRKNVYNVDLLTALTLDRYTKMSAQYSDTANLGGIEESIYSVAEVLEQWGIPIALGLTSAVLTGGLSTLASAAGTSYMFANTFAQEAGERTHLLYNKDIPTDVAFESLISTGLLNASIELLSFSTAKKATKGIAGMVAKDASVDVGKEALEKNAMARFKESVILKIKDKAPYLVQPLKFTKGYLSFTTPEIAQEIGQEFVGNFFERQAINWKNPVMANILEESIEQTIEAAPKLAKSMALLYLLPLAGGSSLSGVNKLLKHNQRQKNVKAKDMLDEVLTNIIKNSENNGTNTIQDEVNSIFQNTQFKEVYVDPDLITFEDLAKEKFGLEDVTPETFKNLTDELNLDEETISYYKRINKPVPINIGTYAKILSNQKLTPYMGIFSVDKSGKTKLDLDADRIMLEEVAKSLRTDSMEFKEEFKAIKKQLKKEKTITFNKNMSKGKEFQFAKDLATDIVSLFHYSFKVRGGVKTPKVKIHILNNTDEVRLPDVSGDKTFSKIPEDAAGLTSTKDVDGTTNIYIFLEPILYSSNNYQTSIVRTMFHEIGHHFYNNEIFLGEENKEFEEVKKELQKIVSNKDFIRSIGKDFSDNKAQEIAMTNYLTQITEAFARVFETSLLYDVLANKDYTKNLFGKYSNFINDDAKLLNQFYDDAMYYDSQLLNNTKLKEVLTKYIVPLKIRDFYTQNKVYTVFTDKSLEKLVKRGKITENEAEGIKGIVKTLEAKSEKEIGEAIFRKYKEYDNNIIKTEQLAIQEMYEKKIRHSPLFQAMTYISGNTYKINSVSGKKIIKDSHKISKESLDSYLLEAGIDISLFKNLNSSFVAKKNGYNIKEIAESFNIEPIALLKYIEQYSKDPFYDARLHSKKMIKDKYAIERLDDINLYSSETSMNLNSKIFTETQFSDSLRNAIIKEIDILSSLDQNINVSSKPQAIKNDVFYIRQQQLDVAMRTFSLAKIKDTLNPNEYIESFTESSSKAALYLENGDYATAIKYKIKQYASYIYYSKSILLKNRVDALNTFARNMYEHSSDFQKKYGAATYMFVNKILMNIGFMPPDSNKIHQYINDPLYKNLTYKDFYDQYLDGFGNITRYLDDEKMSKVKNYGDISVNMLFELLNNIEAAKVIGATKSGNILAKRNESHLEIIDNLRESLSGLRDKDKPKGAILKLLKHYASLGTKFSTIIKIITRNDPNHFLYKKMLNKELDCNAKYAVLSHQYEQAIMTQLNKLAEANGVSLQEYLKGKKNISIKDIAKFREKLLELQTSGKAGRENIEGFFKDEFTLTNEELLMVALNAGNQHNLDILASQNNISQELVDAVRDILTDQELEAVQSIHDSFEIMAKNSFEEQEKINSVRPVGVGGTEYMVRGKVYKGGYFPILTQSFKEGEQSIQYDNSQKDISQMQERVSSSQLTDHGFLQAREDTVFHRRSLQLEKGFDKLLWFTDHVAKDTAWRRYLIDVKNTFLADRRVEDLLNYKIGSFTTAIIKKHLEAIAGIKYRQDPLSLIAKWVRTGTQLATLGFSAATSLIQIGGIIPSTNKIGFSYVLRGLNNFREQSYDEIINQDVFMLQRKGQYSRDYKDITASWRKELKTKMTNAAFWAIKNIDYTVSRITYIGAYEQYIDKYWVEGVSTIKDAMNYAANVVIETQGSGLDFTLSAVESETGPLYRMFTMYMTFNNAALNAILLSNNKLSDDRITASKVRAFSTYFILLPIMSMILRGSWLYLADSDDENDKVAYKKMRGEVIGNMFGMAPFIGNILYPLFVDTPVSLININDLFNDINKLKRFGIKKLSGKPAGVSTEKAIDTLAKSGAIWTNLPIQRPINYLNAFARYVNDADYTTIDLLNKMLNNHTKKQK